MVAVNRRAWHDYHILETFEAGLVLKGTEVKSLRAAKAQISDSFCRLHKGEAWLYNLYISPYEQGNIYNVDPRRTRKLLLHQAEIKRLIGKTTQRGLSLIPLKLYFRRGVAKVEIALVRGKQIYDKREVLKKKEIKREIERGLREFQKGTD